MEVWKEISTQWFYLQQNIKTETVENIKRTSLVLQRTEEEEDAVYLCDLTVIR